ncbi:hypothetical protein [Dyadobacter aurulentus]|uniref:hypothetical protein n=1 Tax=Dyadobacter sp. UC 10 TaxID=2605428 RepID=UPI0011F187E5|nr:hypothetical protein [Dyadobacter sp. UC 10]KAA0993084.1 hypothetical protein FXO21_24370 [Dyadobacter sp. UC 10]
MKSIIIILTATIVVGCFPERFTKSVVGSPTDGENPGYWILVDYRKKGGKEDPNKISEKVLLEVQYLISEKDSLDEPHYHKGIPYYIFSFFNSKLHKTDSLQAVQYGHRYDRKLKRSQFWYQINKESGFAAFLDAIPDGEGETHRIELSNVMKSATYKPELDSLRYIYEPTSKFR